SFDWLLVLFLVNVNYCIPFEMDELPSYQMANAVLDGIRKREEKELQVFDSSVDLEEAAHCRCECCPSRESQEEGDYCCSSLFSLDLVKKVIPFRDGLITEMTSFGSHSCICKDPLFSDYLLTESAVRSAAVTYSMLSGEEITDKNKSYRYGAYRLIIATTIGHLGKGARIRLPSCFVQAVRQRWPSANYTGFTE
ncbi:hypothetical protein PENTCL1PPCAC_14055, partial [Pristionchus entomophagus]